MPVGYFLIDSLDGVSRKGLVQQCLRLLNSSGVDVEALTFDGASSNIAMAKNLGCSFDVNNLKPYFSHPTTNAKVNIMLDACHMLKLIRNTFADWGYIKDEEGNGIKYSLIKKLFELQESTGLRLGNKLSRAHIEFKKKIMNVKLAAQIFSDSIADALEFLSNNNIPGFEDSAATIKFIRTTNRIFDILNSRSRFSKGYKKPLSNENEAELSPILSADIAYIKSLSNPKDGKSMITSNRKTGFIGFIINIESIQQIYQRISNYDMNYLLTYKLSQDHLEMFFGKIRRQGGWNNNPTAMQFRSAFKKLLVHNEVSEAMRGNCMPLEELKILSVTSKKSSKASLASKRFIREINGTSLRNNLLDDYEDEEQFELDEEVDINLTTEFSMYDMYYKNVVSYIAGFVVSKLLKRLKCQECCSVLEDNEPNVAYKRHFNFISRKNKGGLRYPSKDVVDICLSAEKNFKANTDNHPVINIEKLTRLTALSFIGCDIFSSLDSHNIESDDILNCHVPLLLKAIASCYIECRTIHATKSRNLSMENRKIQCSRQMSNKLILFTGN